MEARYNQFKRRRQLPTKLFFFFFLKCLICEQCNQVLSFLFILLCLPPRQISVSLSPLCLTVLSAQGVSRTTLMCGDTWQARWPLGLSLITLDPNPSGIKPAKPNSHCGSWLASAGTTQMAAEGGRTFYDQLVGENVMFKDNKIKKK